MGDHHIAAASLIIFHMRRHIIAAGGLLRSGSPYVASVDILTNVRSIAAAVTSDISLSTAAAVGFHTVAPAGARGDCPSFRGLEVVANLPMHFEAAMRTQKRIAVAREPFQQGNVVFQGHASDSILQLIRGPSCAPAAGNVELRVGTCACGAPSVVMVATQPIEAQALVIAGGVDRSRPCILGQFDGSATPGGRAGGAGYVVYLVDANSIKVLTHAAVPLEVDDNFEAEIRSQVLCTRDTVSAAQQYLLATGTSPDVVIQGDLKSAIAFMQYAGRVRRPSLALMLSELRLWLSAQWRQAKFVHLSREVNKVADYLAGLARAEQIAAVLAARPPATAAPPLPPALLAHLGFVVEGAGSDGTSFPCMHEVPSIAHFAVARYLHHNPAHMRALQAYLARAHTLTALQ